MVTNIDDMRWNLYGNQSYVNSQFLSYSFYGAMLRRLLFMTLGSTLALLIFKLYPRTSLMAKVGKATLLIYLLHTFVITELNHHISDSPAPLYFYALAITVLLYLLAQTPLAPYLTNPISRILRK